ncbi:hypothetical protein MMC30_005333 [Trapelia coarctata]|nr:hypothetical protein [Trapelia coarctata]
MSAPSSKIKSVLVTGANGYIGNAVARAFVRAGWTTYGLVRNPQTTTELAADEITPILGSPANITFLESLYPYTKTFDVIVSTTEQVFDYVPHYNDVISFLRTLSTTSNASGVRPLVLFTSGCKDYGTTDLHGSPNLSPHTESSPLRPQPVLVNRATNAVKIFDHSDLFDAVLLRPTPLYGFSSSYYGPLFDMAAKAAKEGILELPMNPRGILHGAHVDDCAEAYVAIAEHPHVVKGQCYNVSGYRYETLEDVAKALVKEYHIRGGVKFVSAEGIGVPLPVQALLGASQWVGSEKVRNDVSWKDKRLLFTEGLHTYRGAYEAAIEQEHGNVKSIKERVRMAEAMKGGQ